MTKRERLHAALNLGPVDRPPVALWRHFPGDDQRAETLASAHVAFERAHDWDFLKVTPASGYYGDDWGLRAGYKPNRWGARTYHDRPIKKAADWGRLRPLDVTAGAYGRELHALRLIADEVGTEVPVLSTVFSPLTVASTLAGDQAVVRYLREDPDALHAGLEVIADVTGRFAAESLGAGADGVFFATQMASTAILSEEEYEEFGKPYDLRVLDAASRGVIVVLHLHGKEVMFDLLGEYPVQAVNWEDRTTPPSLADARMRSSLCLIGGLDGWGPLAAGGADAVRAQVRDAVEQTGGRGLIVSAGCTIPVDAPAATLRAAREAVEDR